MNDELIVSDFSFHKAKAEGFSGPNEKIESLVIFNGSDLATEVQFDAIALALQTDTVQQLVRTIANAYIAGSKRR